MTRQKLYKSLRQDKTVFYEKPIEFCPDVLPGEKWFFVRVGYDNIFLGYSEKDAYKNFIIYKYSDLVNKILEVDYNLQRGLYTEKEYMDQLKSLVTIANNREKEN